MIITKINFNQQQNYFKNVVNNSQQKHVEKDFSAQYDSLLLYNYAPNISFNGLNSKMGNIMHENVYEDFLNEFHKKYGNVSLEKVIREIFKNEKELNSGSQKKVYIFPKLEDYVIAHIYKKEPLSVPAPICKTQIKYPRYNFGEPIATNEHDIIIMKRVNGIPNSVSNTTEASLYICTHGTATRQMSEEYMSKLDLFKDFPQSAYDDLLQQIEYLSKKGQFVDFINSNNVLIDTAEKKFHIIDLLPEEANVLIKASIAKNKLKADTASIYDAIHLLLVPRFQSYFMEFMSNEEKQMVIKISEDILKKIIKASKHTTLSKFDDLIRRIVKFDVDVVETNYNERFYNRYDDFLNLYSKIIQLI